MDPNFTSRSVELAMKYGIKIHVRSSFKNIGTMVIKEENKIEKVVTGITSSEKKLKLHSRESQTNLESQLRFLEH